MREIYNFKKYNCYLIEDACHALGASYKIKNRKRFVIKWLLRYLYIFFAPLKTITSGEGGIITTKNKDIFNKIKLLRSHGILRNSKKHWQYDVIMPGFNYRLSDINCALAYSQFKKIDKFITYRKKIFLEYKKNLSKIKNLSIVDFDKKTDPSFHLILLNFSVNNPFKFKEKLLIFLKKKGIYAQYHYIPIYKFKIFENKTKLKNTEVFYKTSLSLPVYFNLKIKDVKRITNYLKRALRSWWKKFQLAIKSGLPVINYKFKKYNSIGKEELKAAQHVLKKKELSSFLAGNLEGGLFVKKFENYLKKFYKVKHAITVNSWTSGLICAVGALDINPGDEIITTPWSMSASAISILHWNAIPIFADIDPNTYCIDPTSIEK